MANITEIEGIGPVYAEKLAAQNIKTVEQYLQAACTRKGRKDLEAATGIDSTSILKWANMADLFRVKGVSTQFAELLKAAGVDTVKELRTRKAENLQAKMAEVNADKKLVRQVPAATQVQGFIDFAKELDPVMEY